MTRHHVVRFALTLVLLVVLAWFGYAALETLLTFPAGVSL